MTGVLSPERALPRPVFDLSAYGSRTALHTADREIGYAELADRAGDLARDVLGSTRRLVLIEGANHPDAVTAYLAALQHGHVALLVPDQREPQLEDLVAAYDPDVMLRRGPDGWDATQRREGSAHELHPELVLLLSTSGSTGSPKLVRLSAENVRSNAASIASYLRLTSADRAATSLPMHYCYGLSVLNSHLITGAGLVLTEGSVVDACFWDRFTDAGATSFAGVPYTFDLLDRSGFAARRLPTLRYITQAGGRLAPERVRGYAEQGRRDGWQLVVMYGQTEATARMAYLPPQLATSRPEAIGVPIPGGSFRIDPVPECPEPGTGELVYTGPNVMLGYAERPTDLERGRTVTELRTGDLARRTDGLYEIVGRRSRHAKLFGLRIDLDWVERVASGSGAPARCVVVDEVLHAFTTRRRGSAILRDRIGELCGLPAAAVRVTVLAELPLTANGKPDHAALGRQARVETDLELRAEEASAELPVTAESLRDEYALVLGRPDAGVDSTFVGLGGDSLSYVELATRLGRRLSDLPADWHTRTVADLAATRRRRRGVAVDPTVLIRALAIVAIVGTHANLLTIVGGAHLLLAVAGYNFARFQLADVSRASRVRNSLVAVAQVAVPSTLFVGAVALTTGFYEPATAFLLNGLIGDDTWTDQWQFWFLEAIVWTSLAVVALIALPAADRLERRAPYAFALGVLAMLLTVRFAWVGLEAGPTERYTVGVVGWCFALGWLAARARTWPQKTFAVAATGIGVFGFFGEPERELLVLGGVAALACVMTVRLPCPVDRALGVLAASSLFVYLTHWQVYPHLEMEHPLLATLASFAVGIAYWRLMRPVIKWLGRTLRQPANPGTVTP